MAAAARAAAEVVVKWCEEGVTLQEAALDASQLLQGDLVVATVEHFKRDCVLPAFGIPAEHQVLRSASTGRVLRNAALLESLPEFCAEGQQSALCLSEADPSPVTIRWEERGTVLGEHELELADAEVSVAELKLALEAQFAVPPPAQHLQLHSGDELGDGDHVGYGARVVMTERIAITAIWTEHGKELRQLSIQLGGSTKVADFKRILAEKSGIPAGQIVLRSDHDSSRLTDRDVLGKDQRLRFSDTHKFSLQVRWIERAVVIDPRDAKWAGPTTLAETSIKCTGPTAVSAIKANLEKVFQVAVSQQRLGTAAGKLLLDADSVTREQELLLRVVGDGMLHTSMPKTEDSRLVAERERRQARRRTDAALSIGEFLRALGLHEHVARFEEEELTVALLQNMVESGDELSLQEILRDLRVGPDAQNKLVASLLNGLPVGDQLVVVERPKWAATNADTKTKSALGHFLTGLGLQNLIATFEEEEITLDLLEKLVADAECAQGSGMQDFYTTLGELGVEKADDQRRLVAELNRMRDEN